jgi:outer membrane protein W
MRKTALVSLLVIFVGIPAALAQQKNAVSVFLSEPWIGFSSGSGAQGSAGVGISFARMFTPTVSAQLAIGSEGAHTYPYVVGANGSIIPVERRSFRIFPVDLTVQYHFLNDTRWKPFIGAGAHYVGAPNVGSEFGYQNHLGGLIVGGTTFRIDRSFGIVLEGKSVLGNREPYDRVFRTVIGLDWHF